MEERLQKIIARAGLASRRRAEEMIRSGLVTVNGQMVTVMGSKADLARDHVKVAGKLLRPEAESAHVYMIVHKPTEVVATMSDPEGRESLRELLHGVPERVFPVGRLEYHASGLVFLTNDGVLANQMLKARNLQQTYHFKVQTLLTFAEIAELSRTTGARITRMMGKDQPWYIVTLSDARRDALRDRLFRSGHPVEKIRRIGLAGIELDSLASGHHRALSAEELSKLRHAIAPGVAAISTSGDVPAPRTLPVPLTKFARQAKAGPRAKPEGQTKPAMWAKPASGTKPPPWKKFDSQTKPGSAGMSPRPFTKPEQRTNPGAWAKPNSRMKPDPRTKSGPWKRPDSQAKPAQWSKPEGQAKTGSWTKPEDRTKSDAWTRPDSRAKAAPWAKPGGQAKSASWKRPDSATKRGPWKKPDSRTESAPWKKSEGRTKGAPWTKPGGRAKFGTGTRPDSQAKAGPWKKPDPRAKSGPWKSSASPSKPTPWSKPGQRRTSGPWTKPDSRTKSGPWKKSNSRPNSGRPRTTSVRPPNADPRRGRR